MAKPVTTHKLVRLPDTVEMARKLAERYIDAHLPPGITAYYFTDYGCRPSFQLRAMYCFRGRTEDRRHYATHVSAPIAEMVEDPTGSAKRLLHSAASSIADLLESDAA